MLLIFVLVDSSTPNATRIRMYRRNERVCVCARTFREGERVRKRDKERDCVRARDNIVLERKAVEEGQRERESEPPRGPRVLKCRALLCISRKICSYVRANCAKGSVSLSLSLARLSFFFYAARSFLILPFSPFVPFQLRLFFYFRHRGALCSTSARFLTMLAVSLSLSLCFFVLLHSCSLREREREREGIRASTFRQFIFCTELVRSQSGFLWSRASGNAVATRTAILR